MSFSAWLFYIFSGILLGSAASVVLARNPVHSALSLVLSFVSMAAIWITLNAEFLGLALVVIYVGAVMVFFLFVLMMLDLRASEHMPRFSAHHVPMLLIALIMFAEIAALIARGVPQDMAHVHAFERNTHVLGRFLYDHYLFSLELIGVLLLAAMIATIALVHRKNETAKHQDPEEQIAVSKESRLTVLKMPTEHDLPLPPDATDNQWR